MSKKAKITGFKVSNFKRIKLIEFSPDENGLTILGGRNCQGKSATLHAIGYALGGEAFRPSEINNIGGEENADIRVEIDGLIIERKGKNADLKVTDARGMKGNQTLLNEVVSRFALDLSAFLNAPDKAKLLLQMFPELDETLNRLKTQADAIRLERTDINRDMKRLQMQSDGMAIIENIPVEEIKIEELTAELQAVTEAISKLESMHWELEARTHEHKSIADRWRELSERNEKVVAERETFVDQEKNEVKELEAEFQRRHEEIKARFQKRKDDSVEEEAQNKKQLKEKDLQLSSVADIAKGLAKFIGDAPNHEAKKTEILSSIQSANETNTQIRKNAECRKVYAEMESARTKSDARTKQLGEIDEQRVELLKNADLPLPELSISADGELLYGGQKWDCMSGAEKLKVATAISMGANPKCGFVLIDGLEAMDSETLAEFSAFLAEKEMQGIGTIVGSERATLIIEDGMVQGASKDEDHV